MISAISISDFRKISLTLYFLLVVFLFYSYFLLSVLSIGIFLWALLYQFSSIQKEKIFWKPTIFMILGVLPFVLGVFTSTNIQEAIIELQHNAAYLFLPLSSILLPPIGKDGFQKLKNFCIIVIVLSTIPVLWNYFQNFEAITLSLGSGKAISAPIDHVRYSIFISIGIVFSIIGLYKKERFFNYHGKIIFCIATIYLFFFVHILAVRSGIILSYIGILSASTLVLGQAKKYVVLFILWMAIIFSPIVAYYTIPSFKNKISYTMYDFSLLKDGKGSNYSDSERLRSLEIGVEIWKDNFFFGIGTGDLKSEISRKYISAFGNNGQPKYPHNQWIKIGAASGAVGLLLYLLSIYVPFFWTKNYSDPYILSIIAIMSVSFLVEATLERSYMLIFYLIVLSLLYVNKAKTETN